jgi:hypothetical protein
MATTYIPSKDADLASWADNFSTLITASPTTYGLISGDATAIAAVVDPFLAAYTVITVPATKTIVTVADKNTTKFAMLSVVRSYAQRIATNPGVADSDKIALGLNLHGTPPSPIPEPTTMPIISIVSATPLNHVLRYADEVTPDKRSKPFGAAAMDLFVTIDTTPKTNPDEALFYGSVTKQPYFISYAPEDAGKIATLWARWSTRRGLVGPWSSSISQVIPTA